MVGAYTDPAALFLLAASERCASGGTIAAIQPRSVLAGRDAEPVRKLLTASHRLATLWTDPGPFDGAAVQPCAVVLRSDDGSGEADTVVVTSTDQKRHADPGAEWARVAADVPPMPTLTTSTTLADLAQVLGAFRDEYYGMAGAVREQDETTDVTVLTSGLIDPLVSKWGRQSARVARRRIDRPALATSDLEGKAVGWVERQRRPKMLVANQTKVVEAAIDPSGDVVGITPVIVVLPDVDLDLVRIAAVLTSPVVSVIAATRAAGTGLGAGSIRLSPRLVSELPLPVDVVSWEEAARRIGAHGGSPVERDALVEIGGLMLAAYGVDDAAILDWWIARLPADRRRG